jgi:hypothetical protein
MRVVLSTVVCTSVNVFMTMKAREKAREARESMAREQKYEVLVSAKTREEAIEIASEAIAPGCTIVRSDACDVAADEGKDSFQVTIWFTGGKGEGPA